MPNGYLQPGQRIADQKEDAVYIAQQVIGIPAVSGGQIKVPNIAIGSVAYSSLGTSVTDVIQLWVTDILVPYNKLITKIGILQGATATTDNILWALYNAAGQLIASSAVAGTLLSGANTFTEIAVALSYVPGTTTSTAVTSFQLYGPQQYYIAVQGNGTTAGALRTIAASTFVNCCAGVVAAGTFGTIPATITVPTTFTADKGPIVYVL